MREFTHNFGLDLSDLALERFLQYNSMKEIVFCLDNDANATYSNGSPAPNWGQEAALNLSKKFAELNYMTSVETPLKKDVNDDLYTIRLLSKAQKEHELKDEYLDR